MFDAAGTANAGLFLHVPDFTMHRHEDIGPEPAIQSFELGPSRMAGHMNYALAIGNHLDATFRQQVLHPSDGQVIAGDHAA